MAAAAVEPQFEVVVKGSPQKQGDKMPSHSYEGELGDCPFSHRVLLTLEEKGLPYRKILIDEYNMPDWLEEANPKKQIPVLKVLKEDRWIPDSTAIGEYLEENFPDTKRLGKPSEPPAVAGDLFPKFISFLQIPPGGDGEKDAEKELVAQLEQIKQTLEKQGYLGGDDVDATDLALGPRLYHLDCATRNLKGWRIPFDTVSEYLQRLKARPSWQHTQYTEQYVTQGWQQKLEQSMGITPYWS